MGSVSQTTSTSTAMQRSTTTPASTKAKASALTVSEVHVEEVGASTPHPSLRPYKKKLSTYANSDAIKA